MPGFERWTPGLRARFLDRLAALRDVCAAAGACGLSRQSVYKLRRRDAAFAAEWQAALAPPDIEDDGVSAAGCGDRVAIPRPILRALAKDGPVGEAARFLVQYILDATVDTEDRNSKRWTSSTSSTAAPHRTHSSPISS